MTLLPVPLSLWLILFLPLCASLAILFVTSSYKRLSAWIAFGSVFGSLLLTIWIASLFFTARLPVSFEFTHAWLSLAGLRLEFGMLVNALTLVMLVLVAGIGSAIFYYSMEYMEHDPGYSRYFAFLSFFAFSMLGVILSNNFIQLFMFWELVGLSSYLLIGFWYEKESAADAGKKAFLTNRVGDYGFLLGILLLWSLAGEKNGFALNFLALEKTAQTAALVHPAFLTAACLLIFCGVIGKSAQFPLHVWLPDAMEGPTPVSALIHAATMVAAGVFLLARTFFLFHASPAALTVIAYIGGISAIFSATQALVQTDLKRVLAYSTLSQLGFMVMAVGLGSSGAAMFHLSTHAFFKALLFLAAGSVIHMTHEQDLNRLGGLAGKMPVTAAVFVMGALALSGIYPLSGFWSKEEILMLASQTDSFLFYLSLVTSFLTAFYTARVTVLVFFGKSSGKAKGKDPHGHMLLPLILLAVLSVASGTKWLAHFLHSPIDAEVATQASVMIIATAVSFAGLFSGIFFYQWKRNWVSEWQASFVWIHHMLIQKYFMDRLYDFILENVQKPVAEFSDWFERKIVVGILVNQTARLTAYLGDIARRLQTGRIQTYVTTFLSGAGLLLYFFLWRQVVS